MTATAYYVLTTLGPHSKGDVITFSAEQLGAGIDIARLEALGALRLASGGEIARAMPAQVQAANLFGVGNFTTDVTPVNGTSGTYATLAPYGAVLYDVSQSPPTEYVNTGTQQSPTWTAAGGGGTSLPGVTSSGTASPYNIAIDGQVLANTLTAADARGSSSFNGPGFGISRYADVLPAILVNLAAGSSGAELVMHDSTNATVWEVDADGTELLAGSFAVFGATPPATKPAVTGSRTDGTALASLLTALASYGFITDSTTA